MPELFAHGEGDGGGRGRGVRVDRRSKMGEGCPFGGGGGGGFGSGLTCSTAVSKVTDRISGRRFLHVKTASLPAAWHAKLRLASRPLWVRAVVHLAGEPGTRRCFISAHGSQLDGCDEGGRSSRFPS